MLAILAPDSHFGFFRQWPCAPCTDRLVFPSRFCSQNLFWNQNLLWTQNLFMDIFGGDLNHLEVKFLKKYQLPCHLKYDLYKYSQSDTYSILGLFLFDESFLREEAAPWGWKDEGGGGGGGGGIGDPPKSLPMKGHPVLRPCIEVIRFLFLV